MRAMDPPNNCKRVVLVWHRRTGKDKTAFNIMITKARERVGNYYYYFPTLAEGRKILWDGKDKTGMKFLDHIPEEFIAVKNGRQKKNDHEMKIEFTNGSLFQIMGTDDLNVVGVNPVGCVFSEYSLMNPKAYELITPILRENGGWVMFIYTPRGFNHGWDRYNMALMNDDWFCQLLTINDTDGVFTQEDIEAERAEGKTEELIQQEYYCSFEYGLEGSYFTSLMMEAKEEGRISSVPHNKALGVQTAWDIGVGDSTAIWFYQIDGIYHNFIDYYEMNNEGIEHYVNLLNKKKDENDYTYIKHYAPHDIAVRSWDAKKNKAGVLPTRKDTASDLGYDFITIQRPLSKEDSIQAARKLIPMSRFDAVKCKDGIGALQNYQKVYNAKYKCFSETPLKNWATDGADAFQITALAKEIHGTGTGMSEDQARAMYEQYGPPRN